MGLSTIIAELKSEREKIDWAIAAPVPQNLTRTAASCPGDLLRLRTRGLDFNKRHQHFQFQGDATSKPEGDQKGHCRPDREHGGHAKAAGGKTPAITRHKAL